MRFTNLEPVALIQLERIPRSEWVQPPNPDLVEILSINDSDGHSVGMLFAWKDGEISLGCAAFPFNRIILKSAS